MSVGWKVEDAPFDRIVGIAIIVEIDITIDTDTTDDKQTAPFWGHFF
jgi:hypothetical protein